jgi:hypothetical protein
MMGWPEAWACLVAWRFGDESQQPTCPQVMHIRRWTHQLPVRRHSSQPSADGRTSRMRSRCEQAGTGNTGDVMFPIVGPRRFSDSRSDNIATVGSIESHPDRPELVPVGRRDGWRPALAAVVVLALLLGAAVWKPWEGDRQMAAVPVQIPPGAGGGLVPALTSGPGETAASIATPRPTPATFGALNLEVMGTTDPHPAWGVAVAYVSRTQIDNATRRGSPTVTPVVSWELIEPDRPTPGPRLDHPNVTSVAIAATWPPGTRAVAIRLFHTPFGPGPGARQEVALGESLSGRVGQTASQDPGSAPTSGAFFVAPSRMQPGDPAAWLGRGWPSGAYRLEVQLEGGAHATLPFSIGASDAP